MLKLCGCRIVANIPAFQASDASSILATRTKVKTDPCGRFLLCYDEFMTKYKFTADEAMKFNKHGVDLTVYGEGVSQANVVHVSVEEGHFEEFRSKSYYFYYIYAGNGLFVLDDEKIEAKATDLIVVPPDTRIHYFGKMKMVLTVTPAFREEDEMHIRLIDASENPFREK